MRFFYKDHPCFQESIPPLPQKQEMMNRSLPPSNKRLEDCYCTAMKSARRRFVLQGSTFKCHEEVLYLQPIFFPPDWGRGSEGLDACIFFFKDMYKRRGAAQWSNGVCLTERDFNS